MTDSPYETSANDDAIHSRKRVRRKMARPESWERNVAKSSHLKGCQYKKTRGTPGSASVPPKSVHIAINVDTSVLKNFQMMTGSRF